ncbi:MAG: Gfo/Idh/MocA family oxidoreductase [Bryobacter sp.]|nr:Gfo/Idh/MocA family oxidoreductase [Bryobacter sp. CoA8 C33]
MSKNSFRVAFLGAGAIASTHLAAISRLPGISLVAVCDLDSGRASQLASEAAAMGLPSPAIHNDLERMIAETKPDIVHILLPPASHAAASLRCLAAGVHIFVEKPFCATVAECHEVMEAAARANRQIGVNHNLTYMPAMIELIAALRAAKLGGVEHVAVTYSLPGPPPQTIPPRGWMFSAPGLLMMEIGPHPVSAVTRLLGPVRAARALASLPATLRNGVIFHRRWNAVLDCTRGSASLHLSFSADNYAATVQVFGQDGEAQVDLRRGTCVLSAKTHYIQTNDFQDARQRAATLRRQAWRNLIAWGRGALGLADPYLLQHISVRNSLADFYASLARHESPRVSGKQGLEVVEACQKIIDSAFSHVP